MSEWQDISTAPKYGPYLIYQPEHDMGRNRLAARVVMNGDGGTVRKATLWCSIPPLPDTLRTALPKDER